MRFLKRATVMALGAGLSGCLAEVIKDDKSETAEQARDDIPRRYDTWQEACEWMTEWEVLKGHQGLGPCEPFDCSSPPSSAECAETMRRLYACTALGAEGSTARLAEQRCGIGGTCLEENLEIIDGEPRTYEAIAALWDQFSDCQREQQHD